MYVVLAWAGYLFPGMTIYQKETVAVVLAPFNWGTADVFLLVQDPKWGFSRDRPNLALLLVF